MATEPCSRQSMHLRFSSKLLRSIVALAYPLTVQAIPLFLVPRELSCKVNCAFSDMAMQLLPRDRRLQFLICRTDCETTEMRTDSPSDVSLTSRFSSVTWPPVVTQPVPE